MTHPVDKRVGVRIRNLRRLSGMTQQELASQIGIRYQQIQKYETGANRVSASRLWEISQSLQTQVDYFFDKAGNESSIRKDQNQDSEAFEKIETIELVRAYYQISEPQRRQILNLTRSIASNQTEG